MRRASILLCLLLLGSVILIPAVSCAASEPITTHAQAAAMIDVQSGRILFSQEGDKQMRIASLTKIMTAIVAIEHGKLADKVKVSKRAYGKEGSSLYLKLDEEMSLQHMLYGLMLRSGNDAAVAISEHVGGTVEGFAYLMNEQAKLLGMEHSRFSNPHGLDEQGHYSTANDMAKLTAYALKNPVFQDIVKTKVKKVPNSYQKWDHTWRNKNKMLSFYEGADGVKTGYTKLALRCLVSSATRNGQQLAVVTLSDPDDWADHTRLLDYGFKHYSQLELIHKGEQVKGSTLVAAASFSYALTEEEANQIRAQVKLLDARSVSYKLGERGKLLYYLGGERIGSIPVVEKDSPRLSLKERTAFTYSSSSFPEEHAAYLENLKVLIRALFAL